MGRVLCGNGLRQFREVKPQRHSRQIRPQSGEQIQRSALVSVVPIALFVERPLRIGQRLGAGGKFAALAPRPPGNDRDLTLLRSQNGQNFVGVPGLRFPQDHAPCHDIRRPGHLLTTYAHDIRPSALYYSISRKHFKKYSGFQVLPAAKSRKAEKKLLFRLRPKSPQRKKRNRKRCFRFLKYRTMLAAP